MAASLAATDAVNLLRSIQDEKCVDQDGDMKTIEEKKLIDQVDDVKVIQETDAAKISSLTDVTKINVPLPMPMSMPEPKVLEEEVEII